MARLLPRSGQPPEITLLRHREVVNVPVLNREHPLTQHVTSEIFPFGNITASYNTILVLDGKVVTMDLLCFYERRIQPKHWQAIVPNVSLYSQSIFNQW